jgi:hypothetical protein
MGAGDSKLSFKKGVFRLAEEKVSALSSHHKLSLSGTSL